MSAATATSTAKLARWVFILSVIGYPVFGLLAALMDVDSSVTSMPFRILVIGLSLLTLSKARCARLQDRGYKWLWAFWILYAGRLLWDMSVANVMGAAAATLFFAAAVVLPCYALSRTVSTWQERPIAILLVAFGGATCALAVLMHVFDLGLARSLTEQTGRLFFESVNPISLGHVAATTLVAALCLTRHRLNLKSGVLVACAATAAAACLVLAASRGPVLAFGVCALAFALFTGRWRLVCLAALILLPVILNESSELSSRFGDIEYDESINQRVLLQDSAISEFFEHPVIGSAFVEPLLQTYPHNLVIETGMALGVVGLSVLAPVLLRACVQAWKRLRKRDLLLPLLFGQYLLGAQLSGSLWGNSSFWATVVFLVGYSFVAHVHRKKALTRLTPANANDALAATGM